MPHDKEDPEDGQTKADHVGQIVTWDGVGGVHLDTRERQGYKRREIIEDKGDNPVEALAELGLLGILGRYLETKLLSSSNKETWTIITHK